MWGEPTFYESHHFPAVHIHQNIRWAYSPIPKWSKVIALSIICPELCIVLVSAWVCMIYFLILWKGFRKWVNAEHYVQSLTGGPNPTEQVVQAYCRFCSHKASPASAVSHYCQHQDNARPTLAQSPRGGNAKMPAVSALVTSIVLDLPGQG